MAKRKRKRINLTTRLAVALSHLLTQSERDILRAAKAPASAVLARFEFHHVVPHCPPFNGSDSWWNLDAMPKKAHRDRSKGLFSDTGMIAKVKRLQNGPTVPAGKPKPKAKGKQRAAGKLATGRPSRSWGRPMAGTVASGWRRRFDGTVEKR